MSRTEIRAVLDAHDALARDFAEGRLTFGEFLGGMEIFRADMGWRKFHRQVAGVISGVRGTAELGSLEESGVGSFLPAAGLMRLRELVARCPTLEVSAHGCRSRPGT